MKIFEFKKKPNGRFHIYLCGIKIFSYKKSNLKVDKRFYTCCDIPKIKELLKNRTIFYHPIGIVISEHATIGRSNIIFQNVTIGIKDVKGYKRCEYPLIKDNCVICAGAVILGGIKIGSNCIIGANTIVTRDVPDNTLVRGNPPQQVYTHIPDGYFFNE